MTACLRLLPLLVSLFLLLTAPSRRPAPLHRPRHRLHRLRPPAAPAAAPPCLVWTHIYGGAHLAATRGSINYQYYLAESMRQARIWNPGVPFLLLVDDPERLWRERPHWALLLGQGHLNVSVVDVGQLRDWELIHIEERMRDIWGPLAHNIGTMMMPSLAGGTNMAFTTVTLTRLVYLHHWLRARARAGSVVHVENDQMLYAHVGELVGPAQACGVDFALGRVAPARYAAAVLYLSGAPPLRRLLDFLVEALSHGWQHAAAAAGTYWVTDMSLTAAFVDRAREGNRSSSSVTTFPAPQEAQALRAAPLEQGHCLAQRMGVLVDAAVLGIWCCGDMGRGREWLRVQTEFAESPALFEAPFEWRRARVEGLGGGAGLGWVARGEEAPGALPAGARAAVRVPSKALAAQGLEAGGGGAQWVSVGGGEEAAGGAAAVQLRYPTWNGTRLFNLHMSSKMLHWWRSDDAEPPLMDLNFAGEVGDMP
jgi:hypothetical protein